MSILVHDGSESANYNSYASLAAADAYHGDRASTAWQSASEATRTSALIRATDYIDAHYTFSISPVEAGAVDALVVKATIVMALYALTVDLSPVGAAAVVESEEELVGVVKTRTKYAEGAPVDPYPTVTAILAPLTRSGSVVITRIVR